MIAYNDKTSCSSKKKTNSNIKNDIIKKISHTPSNINYEMNMQSTKKINRASILLIN